MAAAAAPAQAAAAPSVPTYDLVALLSGSKGVLVDGKGTKHAVRDALKDKVVGVYYSASWCAPCRAFTPKFAEVYKAVKAAGKPFEVVFVSSDNKASDFEGYLRDEMPWLALPYEERAARTAISQQFDVEGIPHLTLFNTDGSVITDNGRIYIEAMGAAGFPWLPPRVRGLDIAPEVINEKPCLFVLMEPTNPADPSTNPTPEAVRTAVLAELAALGADKRNDDLGLVVAHAPQHKTGRWRGFTGVRANPCVMITDFRGATGGLKFVDPAPFGAGAATAFLAKYRASVSGGGTGPALKQHSKSGVRPPKDEDPAHPGLLVATAESFAEVVLDESKHVFVDVNADWCGPCKQFAPHLYRVARALCEMKVADIAIVSINQDENDLDTAFLPETSIPNLKLFPKGAKTPARTVKYDGKRTDTALLEWLKAKTDSSFDLAHAVELVNAWSNAAAADAAAKKAAEEAAFQAVIAAGKCTFTYTAQTYRLQKFWGCRTCNQPGLGVCAVCKDTCHKGHDLTDADEGMFFCDCGDGGYAEKNGACKCLGAAAAAAPATAAAGAGAAAAAEK